MDKDKSAIVKTPDATDSVQRFNWTGLNPAQMKGIAQAMAMSGMFPDIQKDSAKAFVKIMAGQEMGIPPFQAMSDISIIGGKAALGGNGHASKVKSNPKYDYRVKRWDEKGCEIEFFQIIQGRRESLGISKFDEEDARRAGLFGKSNWKTYPRNMYFNRAMTAGTRTYCPDALNGVNAYTPEELGANVDEEGNFVSMDDEPTKVEEAPAPEAEITKPRSAIIDISDELKAKGFDDPKDRQRIALTAAGVEKASDLSEEDWQLVYEQIKAGSSEELADLIAPPELGKPHNQKTIEQAMADGDKNPPDSFLAQDDNTQVSDDELSDQAIQTSLDNVEVETTEPAKKAKKGK
jgi:hypothetical protein